MLKSSNTVMSTGTQSLSYCELLTYGKFKLKIDIKSDSYLRQRYARIAVYNLDQVEWKPLVNIAPSLMKTSGDMYYEPPIQASICCRTSVPTKYEARFKTDRDELIRLMQQILPAE